VSFPITEALDLIRSALFLLRRETVILASAEDADYFRSQWTPSVSSSIASTQTAIQQSASFPSQSKLLTSIVSSLPLASSTNSVKKEKESSSQKNSDSRPHIDFFMRSIVAKVAPEIVLIDEIPEDAVAKTTANRWKTKQQSAPISVLSYNDPPEHKAFLIEIIDALNVYCEEARLVDAETIEKEKQWSAFFSTGNIKYIIACGFTLWQLHDLKQFYTETPSQEMRMLGNIPLFLLPDLSLYLREPSLKRSLWKSLCQKLTFS